MLMFCKPEAKEAGSRFDQAQSGPTVGPSSLAARDPLQQIASSLMGKGGGGGFCDFVTLIAQ